MESYSLSEAVNPDLVEGDICIKKTALRATSAEHPDS